MTDSVPGSGIGILVYTFKKGSSHKFPTTDILTQPYRILKRL
jgi:hypothetical protein